MGTPTPNFDDYKVYSIKRMNNTDGSKSEWINIVYKSKNLILTTSGCQPTVSANK